MVKFHNAHHVPVKIYFHNLNMMNYHIVSLILWIIVILYNVVFYRRERGYAIVNYFCLLLNAFGGNPATYKDNLLQGECRAL